MACLKRFIQAFSGIFRDMQQYSAMLRDIEAYSGIIEAYVAIIRHIPNSALTLAYTNLPYSAPWLI